MEPKKSITLEIDGRKLEAEPGKTVLEAAGEAGIFIPALCACPEINYRPASCRLCWVEVEGREQPVLACREQVREGMVVRTRSERVDRLVRSAFELIMSAHLLDCAKCPGNKRCALQRIARERKIPLRPRQLERLTPEHPADLSREDFGFNPNHCVLCGRCVFVCNEVKKCRVLDFMKRGMETVVATFDRGPLAEQENCDGCLQCVSVCPVGALFKMEARGTSGPPRGTAEEAGAEKSEHAG